MEFGDNLLHFYGEKKKKKHTKIWNSSTHPSGPSLYLFQLKSVSQEKV